MKYRKFGKTGWEISEIGFGAWAIGGNAWGIQKDRDSIQALHKALDLGINFIDTAQVYGNGHSEYLIGKVLKERKRKNRKWCNKNRDQNSSYRWLLATFTI